LNSVFHLWNQQKLLGAKALSSLDFKELKQPPPEFYDQDDSDNVCFLCEDPKYKLKIKSSYFGFPITFQECHCGLVKQTPMPNETFFEWFFNSDLFFSAKESNSDRIWGFYDYFKDEPCRLATSKHRYKKLKEVFEANKPLEIMKIGPSTGTFLYVANENGHHAIGCDVSTQFAEYAKENYNVRIDSGRFEEVDYADNHFDVILLFNVVENIPNQVEFFSAVWKKLKPGGYFILNHVNMKKNLLAMIQKEKYFLYRPPICYTYGTAVLEKILNKFGFDVVSSFRDIRYMHMEKILTLLGWKTTLNFIQFFNLHRVPFPIYAYPSKITVSRKL
jgi:2-polyprenyl-3-methyl-5-hydroxy-6-metoxy-1,4-benzoquinol methylase